MSKYIEKQKVGQDVVRWTTDRKFSKKERAEQWKEAEEAVNKGKPICLTDLIINAEEAQADK